MCPTHSMRGRSPTTVSLAPIPDTTSICDCRQSGCSFLATAGVCGCSTSDAAQGHPPRHCSGLTRMPRSSPSTDRRACWRRRRPSGGPPRWPSCTAVPRTSPTRVSTARSTESSPPTWCAIWPTPTRVLNSLRGLLRPGGVFAAHEYSVRDSRLATAVWNAVSSTVIIPAGRLRTGDDSLYRYLRRSVNDSTAQTQFRNRLQRNGFTAVRSRHHARLAAQHRAHLPRPGPAVTDPPPRAAPRAPGLPDASALPARPRVVVVGAGIAGLAAATGARRSRSGRGCRRARDLPRRPRRRLARHSARRHPGRDEPRFPRLLPAVLQPAKPAAPHRPRAVDAHPAGRLSAGRRRRGAATPSAACLGRLRSTRWPSRCAAPPSGCATWCASTPARRRRWPRCRCPRSTASSTTSTPNRSCRTSTFPSRRDIWRSRCSPAASSPAPTALSAAELATMFHIYFLGLERGTGVRRRQDQFRCRAVESACENICDAEVCGSTPDVRCTA